MNELRDEMAMCAHMRVNHKKVLLDGTESGRISDSWVCGDCGTLFIPEAANREQKAQLSEALAEHGKTLLSLNKAAFETIPALEAEIGEQKAEIERLTHRLIRANLAFVLSDAVLPTDFETELPPTKRLHTYTSKLEAELASLRASVGEKPEDVYKRGQEDMMKRVILPSFYGSYPPVPYVAPTLPGEEK